MFSMMLGESVASVVFPVLKLLYRLPSTAAAFRPVTCV